MNIILEEYFFKHLGKYNYIYFPNLRIWVERIALPFGFMFNDEFGEEIIPMIRR